MIFLNNGDKLFDELKSMDRKKLNELLNMATKNLSSEQKQKVSEFLNDKKKMDTVKSRVTDDDLKTLKEQASSNDKLKAFLNSDKAKSMFNNLFKD